MHFPSGRRIVRGVSRMDTETKGSSMKFEAGITFYVAGAPAFVDRAYGSDPRAALAAAHEVAGNYFAGRFKLPTWLEGKVTHYVASIGGTREIRQGPAWEGGC